MSYTVEGLAAEHSAFEDWARQWRPKCDLAVNRKGNYANQAAKHQFESFQAGIAYAAALASQREVPPRFVLVPRKTIACAVSALAQIIPCAHPDCKQLENETAERTYSELEQSLAAAPSQAPTQRP